ncbi:MAG: redoxin domain-containing protein [Gemmataceae bacterium]
MNNHFAKIVANVVAILATITTLFVSGCTDPATIPTGSGRLGYEQAAFKDNVQTNSNVVEFPQTFIDSQGRLVDLNQLKGRKVLLVVLRGMPLSENGDFCPSCLAQTGGLLTNREEFEKRGAEVLLLFPGPSDRVGEFIETARQQTPGEPSFTFRLLLDKDLKTCTSLGIRADLAKPSTYILDRKGRVTFAYVGETSTDRPSVKAVLSQLDRAP